MTNPPSSAKANKLIVVLLLFIFLIPAVIGIVLWQTGQHDAQSTLASCNVRTGCILPGGAVIQFTPPTNITQPFNIQMHKVPEQVQRITIHFTMRNMELGFNQTDFKPQGKGVWLAKNAVLPLCVDERNDFLGDLSVDGKHYNIIFTAP